MALCIHGGLIIFLGAIIAIRAVPFWPLLLPVQGILIIFLFTLLHESIHRTAFQSAYLNDVVAHVCGFLVGVQPEWFRYFHFAHHRHTQDPDNDPELATPKPRNRWQYVLHVSGLPIWWSFLTTLLRHGFSGCEDDFVPVAGRAKVVLEARLVLAGYAVVLIAIVFLNFQVLLWIWLVPVVLGQPFLRLYLLAEHGRCPQVANMLHNSRTTYTNALVRRLAWNMPYHAEHHSYPGVPFHQLPNFHQIIQSHIRETEQGYIRFNAKYIQSFERSGEVAESLGNDDGNGGRPQADSEPPPGAG